MPQDESRDRRCESRNNEEAQGPWEGDDVPDLAVDQPAHADDGKVPRRTPAWVGQERVRKTEAHEAPLPVRVKEGQEVGEENQDTGETQDPESLPVPSGSFSDQPVRQR